MAVDLQDLTAVASAQSFRTIYQEPERWRTGEPWGVLKHRRLGGSDVLNGSGVGDTAALRLSFPLMPNFGHVLRRLVVNLRTDEFATLTGLEQAYSFGRLETFIGEATDPKSTTQIDYACGRCVLFGSNGVPDSVQFSIGGGFQRADIVAAQAAAAQCANVDASDVPAQYSFPGPDSAACYPTFATAGIGTAVDAGTVDYYAEWWLFDINQMEYSATHWPSLVR